MAQLERALIDAGPRGLTFRELVDLDLFPGRFIDTRMRELGERRRIRVDYGKRGEARRARGDKSVKPWRWVDLGPRAPLVPEEPEVEPRVFEPAPEPECALTGDLR
jgi:hypothetical protein